MASKAATAADTAETREDAAETPLLDTIALAIKKMVLRGKERGYLTYDELNAALPQDQVSSEQIEDTMTMLSELGVNVIESEESEEPAEAEAEDGEAETRGNVDGDDIGRTDDPVRMYLREMGSVELLSREGESSSTEPISRRYMRTGSSVRPMSSPSTLPRVSASPSSASASAGSSLSSLSITLTPSSESIVIVSSICSEDTWSCGNAAFSSS